MNTVVAEIITGIVTILVTIITVVSQTRKTENEMRTELAVIKTEMTELTREVRLHNDFARRMPVLEEKMSVANHRIADLEEKIDRG